MHITEVSALLQSVILSNASTKGGGCSEDLRQQRHEVRPSVDAVAVHLQDLLVVLEPPLLLHAPVRYAVQLVHRRDQRLVRRRRLQQQP